MIITGIFLLAVSATAANAATKCIENKIGHIVCAPQGGSIMTNKDGDVVCGMGQCVTNKAGVILCSSQPGGTAIINNLGMATCSGVCVSASQKICRGAR